MPEKKIRRLAAIIFTDIVGYTALMQDDENRTATIRSRHRDVLEKQHHYFHGEIIQYYGDGSLSLFKSAIEAVECAMVIQKELRSNPRVPLRIGIHVGDVVMDGEAVYGDGINLASRIESLGIPGSILISDRMNQELRNHKHILTQSLGYFEFKNVKTPLEVFAISNQGLRVPQRSELKGKLAQSKKSIAVLPFVNMSSDSENEYFSDGVSEEILNALVKVEGLQVIARTSSFAFKGKNMDVREIGRLLNVAHVLEGSVRKAGKRVRITVQLVNTMDGFHHFSDTYDRNLEDIFAVQDEIAQKVTNRLREHLAEKQRRQSLVEAPTENFEAYETYLKGLFHVNKWGYQAARKAMPYFEKAIQLQEDFAPPHAYLAWCYLFFAFGGRLSWAEAYAKAMPSLKRALELDPESVDALFVLTGVQTFFEWDWKALEKTIDKLLQLYPGDARIYHPIATYYNIWGDLDAAIEKEHIGYRLNPLSVALNFYLGLFYTWKGEYETANNYLNIVLDLAPGHRPSLETKGWNCVFQHQLNRAIGFFNQLEPEMGYRFHRSTCLGYTYGLQDEKDKAQHCLQQLQAVEKQAAGRYLSVTLDLAVLYIGLGNIDQAFYYLEQAIDQKIGDSMMFQIDPIFLPLRTDPRFEALKEKISIQESNLPYISDKLNPGPE